MDIDIIGTFLEKFKVMETFMDSMQIRKVKNNLEQSGMISDYWSNLVLSILTIGDDDDDGIIIFPGFENNQGPHHI